MSSVSSNEPPSSEEETDEEVEEDDSDGSSRFEWSMRDYLSDVSNCSGSIIGRKFIIFLQ